VTEPAPPSGVDRAGQPAGLPDTADPGAGAGPSQWARPGAAADEGPSIPPAPSAPANSTWPAGPQGPAPFPGPAGGAPAAPQGYAPAAGPGWGVPAGGGWGAMPPPPREPVRPPKRVDPVPGTPFGLVYLDVPPVTSGLAVGSLVAGVASILVSLLVACFGIGGRNWGGAWAAGAFTVLGVLAGVAAIVAGSLGLRQIRRPAPPPAVRFTGRGLALAGVSCGVVGLVLSLLALVVALVLQFA
jgi:hypothetical protein